MPPSRSLPELILYFLYQAIRIPIRRLFKRPRAVKEWSIRTELSVTFLKRMLDNRLESSRKVEKQVAKTLNMTVKDPMVSLGEPNFRGLFVGGESSTVILYLHGGGYSLCSATTYIASLSRLLAISKQSLRIFSLEYTLAPEAQFPGQINEAKSALEYLAKTHEKIFIMGDSAGGNLVMALLQTIKDDVLVSKVKGGILVSPWVNFRNPPLSNEINKDSDYVELHQLEGHVIRYVPASESILNPLISPTEMTDFIGIPPLFVHYGAKEIFMGDIQVFVEKAKKKVDVTVMVEEFGPHITPMLYPFFPDMAERGLQSVFQWIQERL